LAEKRHGVPALLSFFIPGLGQLVKGDLLTTALVFVGGIFGAVLLAAGVGFVILPIVWIWNIYDAYTAPDGPTKRELKRLSNLAIILACSIAMTGCGNEMDDPPPDAGTGGAALATGGTGGGSTATGGQTGTGGASAAGAGGMNVSGSGGQSSAPGTGGQLGAGGTGGPGTGGATGGGGAKGTGGAGTPPTCESLGWSPGDAQLCGASKDGYECAGCYLPNPPRGGAEPDCVSSTAFQGVTVLCTACGSCP